jgi:hypothetical protein
VNWAIAESKRLWPEKAGSIEPVNDPAFDLPEGPRALFAGDALTRALAAEAMGGGGPMKPDPRWAGPFLIEAFDDNYPIVRFFVANGLSAHSTALPKPDYLGTLEARVASLNQWRSIFDQATRQNASTLADRLRAKRKDTDIEVGE